MQRLWEEDTDNQFSEAKNEIKLGEDQDHSISINLHLKTDSTSYFLPLCYTCFTVKPFGYVITPFISSKGVLTIINLIFLLHKSSSVRSYFSACLPILATKLSMDSFY